MSVSMAAMSPGSHKSETIDIAAETASAAPYAQATWINLAEQVPTETDAPDVYVRLIAVEGEVLLPVDHVR